jgi:DNA helicase II / ATP-dependent DNA helicase PcrA
MLAKQLAAKNKNICVVGDPDQSIYSWRAADLRNIMNFEKDYPNTKVVLLEQNYRSTKTILEIASNIIATNRQRKDKRLWTDNEAGEKVIVVESYNEQEEALFVVGEIERLSKQGIARPQDCAIMYRTNAQSRVLEEAFLRYGLPYRLVGATRFYARREIKDIIAYLKLINNPYDSVSMSRIINVPPRGIGQRTMEQLNSWAQAMGVPPYAALQVLANQDAGSETDSSPKPTFSARIAKSLTGFLTLLNGLIEQSNKLDPVALLDETLKHTGYRDFILTEEEGEERWDNILELRTVASQYKVLEPKDALTAFLEGVALVSDIDNLDAKSNAATLITLHQAKGLEFPVVFILGLEEGVLPHKRSFDDPSQMEEERRLCYVGVTRAKKRLYLIRAFRRSLMGASTTNPPSRFLEDIPTRLITSPQTAEASAKTLVYNPSTVTLPPVPEPSFKAGEKVRHEQFGQGVVINCQPISGDQEVTVAFKGSAGLKRLLLSFAKLERI